MTTRDPVCKKQQPTIARLEKEKPGLIVYEVSFAVFTDADADVD